MKKMTAGLLIFLVINSSTVYAMDYVFEQQIVADMCTLTDSSNTNGTVLTPGCVPQSPTVTSAMPNNGHPLVSGLFDAVHGSAVRVKINGVWYSNTVSPLLTVSGNRWTLNLLTEPQILPGTYDVIVEHTLADGTILGDSTSSELVIQEVISASPTVSPLVSVNGSVTLAGTYDALHSQSLSVTVDGYTYMLGVDSELSVIDNAWSLNLQNRIPPLAVGVYDVKVSTIATDGRMITDVTVNEIIIQNPMPLPPTVTPVQWVGGQPVITGTVGDGQVAGLRVFVDGRWYVLDADIELTMSDADWRLDLTRINPRLTPGIYDIVVQATYRDSRVLGDTTDDELVILPETIGNVVAHPTASPLAHTGMNIYKVAVFGIIIMFVQLTALGLVLFFRYKHRSLAVSP